MAVGDFALSAAVVCFPANQRGLSPAIQKSVRAVLLSTEQRGFGVLSRDSYVRGRVSTQGHADPAQGIMTHFLVRAH